MFLILHTLFGVLLHKFRQNKVFIQQSIVWIWNFVRCNMGLPAVVSGQLFCCRLVPASCLQDRKRGRHADGDLPKCKKESLFRPSLLVTPTGLKPVTFWSVVRCSSDADRTQTCNLLIRSQMLYSIKLRRLSFIASANVGWLTGGYKNWLVRLSLVFRAAVSFGLHVGLHNRVNPMLVKQ